MTFNAYDKDKAAIFVKLVSPCFNTASNDAPNTIQDAANSNLIANQQFELHVKKYDVKFLFIFVSLSFINLC